MADRAALQARETHLEAAGVLHSSIITAIQAWLLVVQGPDGNRIRLYAREQHGPKLGPDEEHPWLQS